MNIINTYKALFISIFTIAILSINSLTALCQLFDSGQNPPSVKFKQINTPHFQIIYPTSLEHEAQRMANTLEDIILQVGAGLDVNPRKISIILQNQGTESNGFVQLAPRRSEFYTTPPQSFDYQDWLNSLAAHELRHVVQFEKLTGKLKAPFFEELALAVFGITLPPWFYEGDAVGTETALTNAGRGRLPEWDLIFRTNTLSGKKYSYSKDYLGSVKDRTPGYYQLGYFMTTKLKRDEGRMAIDSIFERLKSNPFRPYNLSRAVKKISGMNTKNLHDSTVHELEKLWKNQSSQIQSVQYKSINKRQKNIPQDYLLPQHLSDGKILVLKQSSDRSPALLQIDKNGKEKRLVKIGFQEQPNFNYANGKIVWDEFRYDKRFQKRSFSVINIYDLKTKSVKQLTHQSRLFSPALSADASFIIAVKLSADNRMTLVELNPETGESTKEYPNADFNIIQNPSINFNGDKIIFNSVSKNGNTLVELDRSTGISYQLIPFQQQLISNAKYAGDDIIFRAHYNGIDNIYKFNHFTKKITQISNAQFGAFNPSYHQFSDRLYFNNYQLLGHDASSVKLNEQKEKSIENIENTFIDYAKPLSRQENTGNVFDSIPNRQYESKPFHEINNLFYFHSLEPIADGANLYDDNIGFKFISNNKLNTMDFYAGYQYDNNLKKSEYLTGFTYKKFYPILDVRYINRARLAYSRRLRGQDTVVVPVNWRENFTELEVSVPFLFNRLNDTYSMGFNTSSSYTYRYNILNRSSSFRSELLFPMKYQVYLNHNVRRSARDLAPQWGQNLTFTYQHFPFSNINGDLFSFRSLFYLPGFFTNHSIQARFNYQLGSGAYDLTTDIPRVTGYSHLTTNKYLTNTLLLNYRFPIAYPDWELGPLAYIKRIRGGFFTDFENFAKRETVEPRTFGAELYADMNLLRFYLPNFALGGKVIFVNEKPAKNPIFEMSFTYSY
ncbi:MAG: hypothetical protein ABI390_11615 [Daejeonella sp.]